MIVTFFVAGVATTQGSHVGIATKSGKVIVREKHKSSLEAWRDAIATEARQAALNAAIAGAEWPITGPVLVTLAFGLQRPTSAPKRRRTWPIAARSGDVDKLARACLDALTGVLVADDAQVVGLAVTKDYGRPGVFVAVDELEADATIDYRPAWQPVLHLDEAPA